MNIRSGLVTILFTITILILSEFFNYSNAEQVINLVNGQAIPLKIKDDIGTVFIANPKIADYQVIDKNKVVIYGKSSGKTSLIIFNMNGNATLNEKIVIHKDLSDIQQQVDISFPNNHVSISNIGNQIILSGTVNTESQKRDIEALVVKLLNLMINKNSYNGKDESNGNDIISNITINTISRLSHIPGIVNNIKVATIKQVNVKLTIAEVSHSFLEEFGMDYYTDGETAGVFVNNLTHFSASDLISVITAIGDDSVGQILAQPNLSVISGGSASFLVGGELPVITTVNDTINYTYKEYGIRLSLTANVLRDDQIKLSLTPEVSSLDQTYDGNDTYDIPALKTRKAQTTVELGDGQSFVLGGLLSTEETEQLTKVPYISDIPIIGALFRHSSTERKKTELVIIATVNLVKPVHESDIQLPSMHRTSTLQRFFGWKNAKNKTYPARNILDNGGFIE